MASSPPPHWGIQRLKSVACIVNGGTPSSTVPEYWNGNIIWITPDDLGKLNTAYVKSGSRSITQEGYDSCSTTLAPAGSIAISTRAPIGHTAILEVNACVNQGCRILVPNGTIQTRYLYRSLTALKHELSTRGKGTTFDELSHGDLGTVPILVPPPDEQAAIVRYLDHVDELFSRYISAKERLIALLEDQRQAVIQQAVTYGLDPDLPIKPSGIDWVDLIPSHWKTAKIQTLALLVPKSFTDGDWIESPYITSDGIRLIQTGNIGTGQYVEQGYRYINEATFKKFNCTEIAPNDILICRLGDPVARACLAPDLGKRMITSVDVCIIKPHRGVNATFAVFVMNSPKYLGWVKSLVRGSTRDRISRSMLSKFQIPFPPLQEQDEIVDYLQRVTENIDASKKNTERQIRLMHEYRTRLIADVVTGQIDVRNATVELPGQHL